MPRDFKARPTVNGSGVALLSEAGGGMTGEATLNFGAFPGASDASVAVTGQAGVAPDSSVQAWVVPKATADHSVDEHILEAIKVFAGNIVAGTGFTIYGISDNQLQDPAGNTPMLWGQWSVRWAWT